MRCIEFQQRMNDLLDQRRQPETDRRLRLHAQNCMHCLAVLRLQSVVLSPIGVSTSASPPAREVEFRTEASQPWRRLAGTAAALALGVALCVSMVLWNRVDDNKATLNRTARVPTSLTRQADRDELTQLEGRHLADPTARMIAWRLSPPIHWGAAASQVEIAWGGWLTSVEPANSGVWLKHVEKGFGPLAHSLTSTINVIRSTWPISRSRHSNLLPDALIDTPSLDTDPAHAG